MHRDQWVFTTEFYALLLTSFASEPSSLFWGSRWAWVGLVPPAAVLLSPRRCCLSLNSLVSFCFLVSDLEDLGELDLPDEPGVKGGATPWLASWEGESWSHLSINCVRGFGRLSRFASTTAVVAAFFGLDPDGGVLGLGSSDLSGESGTSMESRMTG